MPTPPKSRRGAGTTAERRDPGDLRCPHCDAMLGRREGERVRVRSSSGHEYLVTQPVWATCKRCGTLSEHR